MSFGDLLGGDLYFSIPALQRPFEWGEQEVGDMVGDLIAAFEGRYDYYFLGHIVAVANGEERAQIVDGQQRLTTTTIVFAYVRDRLAGITGGLSAELQRCILDERAKLALRPNDEAFFRQHVQTPGGLSALLSMETASQATDAQTQMVLAARTVRAKLDRFAIEPLQEFARFVMTRAVVDYIVARDRSGAAILYRGLNTRGKQLSEADLQKAEAIEGTGMTADAMERAARTWEEHEDELGRDNFSFLLSIMPLLVSLEPLRRPGDLREWRQKSFDAYGAEAVLTEHLPQFATLLKQLLSGNLDFTYDDPADQAAIEDVNRRLRCMQFLEDRHWIAPAIAAVAASRHQPRFLAKVFRGLDLLSFASFLNGIRHEDRARRFAEVLRAGRNETFLANVFELTKREREAIVARLHEPFKRDSWRRRAIGFRINAAFPGARGFAMGEDVTVEHVLPASFNRDWEQDGWDARTASQCSSLIGNFVVVSGPENIALGAQRYGVKHRMLFGADAPKRHPITEDIRHIAAWTPEVVRKRCERMTAMLLADWGV